MATASISIEVDEDTARNYAEASDEDRRKLQLLLRLRLQDLTVGKPRPLLEVMDDMGEYAQSQGLTPEILESLLNGD